jgi:C4-dicarboxylate transporter, DctM subunit
VDQPDAGDIGGRCHAVCGDELARTIVGVAIIAIFAITVASVWYRYALNAPVSWTEQVCRILFVWSVFAGAAVLYRNALHIVIDMIVLMVPQSMQKALSLLNETLPGMRKAGYDSGFAAAITASASVMGPIIPPSIPLVIYGLSVGKGVSVAALFMGGVVPGLMLGFGLAIATYIIAKKRNYPVHEALPLREVLRTGSRAIWALMMPFVILFGVTGGVVTVTESAAFVVLYALFVAMVIHRELAVRDLWKIFVQSGVDSAVVMINIAFASTFGWLMAVSGLPKTIAAWIGGYSKDPLVLLFLINGLLLIVGCFMEAIAAMIILIPVLIPIVEAADIDLVHFGLVMVFNLMLGLLTPPVGILLYICGNFAEVKIERVVREVLPFLAVGLVVLVLITLFPKLVLWLPNLLLK